MKPAARLGALCLALCCLGGARGLWRSDSHEWHKLIMVHHWPATVCKEVKNHCKDPPDYWTIHGLWPDKSEGCNRSWHFNPEEIKDLLPDMRMYWPDLLHPSPNRSLHLWKHEWEKHGTCAAQLEALNSQKKYFGKSLDLSKELALNRFQILKMPLSACTESCPKSSVFQNRATRRCSSLRRLRCASPRTCSCKTAWNPGSRRPEGRKRGRRRAWGWRSARTASSFTPHSTRPITDAHIL
ncbi:ribonuclease T2 isoform X2 [Neophocaena asiaeorientalis asiaeorientalis]|uniref:Ribonuclease T2 isoform X2 n=1 Tax=Neophocaena asiaeorientalis asiaeorientalis TaxID=1706337 RepID=A0A341BD57_NEOAA|nr:ribonuclease T2 isoform X2 [Neophocaena asiaeorientalis asiaeorientalis]